jgi:hypothetical protein
LSDDLLNPYATSDSSFNTVEDPHAKRPWAYLAVPLLIPPAVHMLERMWIPPTEDIAHLAFIGLALLIAWAWSISMVDRLKLSFWTSYVFVCGLCAANLASAIATTRLFAP